MKKIFLLSALLCLVVLSVHALPYQWGKMILPKSVYGESKPRAVKYDNGYIYVYGSFKDTIDLDMGNSSQYVNSYNYYSASGYLAKYDLLGNRVWSGSLKGIKTGNPNCIAPPYNEILDMVFDANHNVYITGFYDDSVRFEFGGVVQGLKSPCGISSFVVKLNPGGDVLQAHQVTGMQCPTYFSGTSLTLDQDHSLYTLTDFYGTGDFDFSAGTKIYDHQIYSRFNVVVSRYDKNSMALEWSGMLEASKGLYAESILTDQNKNMYVSGKFIGSMDVDLTVAANMISSADTSHWDYFIIKYDSNGNYQWVNRFAFGGSFDFDVMMDHSQHLILASSFSDHIDLSHNNVAQTTLNANAAGTDLLCAKMDLSGNLLWAKRIGGTYADYFQGLSISPGDQLLLTGWFNLATSLDPQSMNNDYAVVGQSTNGLMTCLSPSGSFVFGGISRAQANPNNNGIGGATYQCSVWDPAGNVFVGGTNIWQSDVNPDTAAAASNVVMNTNNNFNSYVMRLGNYSATGLQEQQTQAGIRIYPSPARSYCQLQSEESNLVSFAVYNSLGQLIEQVRPRSNSYRLDVSSYPAGLYIIRYETTTGQGTERLMVGSGR